MHANKAASVPPSVLLLIYQYHVAVYRSRMQIELTCFS